jgi:hypothetical protein
MLLRPDEFWRLNVPSPLAAGWVEANSPCNEELSLSKREVLALVLMAYAAAVRRQVSRQDSILTQVSRMMVSYRTAMRG